MSLFFSQCAKEPGENPDKIGNPVWTLAFDPTGRLWIGTDSGLYVFDHVNWFQHKSFIDKKIKSIKLNNGFLLVSGTDGAFILDPGVTSVLVTDSFDLNQAGVQSQEVNVFDIGFNHKKWFGIPSGLVMTDNIKWAYNRDISKNLVSARDVRCIAFREDDLFIGTYGSYLYRIKYNRETDAISGASQLLGGADNPVLNYNGELTTDTIFSLLASSDSSIWFGSKTGLTRNKGETKVGNGVFEYFLRGEKVLSIYESGDKVIYAGTENGLFIQQENAWQHYTVADGLPGAYVYCITGDKEGGIWLGTDKGVARFINGGFEKSVPIE